MQGLDVGRDVSCTCGRKMLVMPDDMKWIRHREAFLPRPVLKPRQGDSVPG